ncbi:MAG: DUF4411 family protein [Candidatus Electryonea clarkiae]|nr:DUF4411 family protein [Candidatus Electryonea clarkiae]MDP8288752.1 DUF4411 family protein [Candidatus Electryonea clarkiae]
MSTAPRYILDANVFIEAARRYYAFDIAPKFWTSLSELALDGRILSIDRVKRELDRGKDDLTKWANDNSLNMFTSTIQPDVINCFRDIMIWLQTQDQYKSAAKTEFAAGADGWLIAYAKTNGCIVVTHEVPNNMIQIKVPIPNVCRALDVQFVDTFLMLRAVGIKFD